MRLHSLASMLALAMSVSAGAAPSSCPPPPKATPPTISKVVAAPFRLNQISTVKVNDSVSHSVYRGLTVLTVTPCDGTPVNVPVRVELSTTTTINGCGDGGTDGLVKLTATATGKSSISQLTAVNRNFGELNGVIEGVMVPKPSTSGQGGHQAPPENLRAVFTAVFTKDANGNYTIVDCLASGVVVTPPQR